MAFRSFVAARRTLRTPQTRCQQFMPANLFRKTPFLRTVSAAAGTPPTYAKCACVLLKVLLNTTQKIPNGRPRLSPRPCTPNFDILCRPLAHTTPKNAFKCHINNFLLSKINYIVEHQKLPLKRKIRINFSNSFLLGDRRGRGN